MSAEERLASMVTYRRFNIKSGKKLTLRNIEEMFSVVLCVWCTGSSFIASNFILPVTPRAPACLPARAAQNHQRASVEESAWNDNSTTLGQICRKATRMRPLVFSSLKSRVNDKTISRIWFFSFLETNYFFSQDEIKTFVLQECSRNLSERLVEVNCLHSQMI